MGDARMMHRAGRLERQGLDVEYLSRSQRFVISSFATRNENVPIGEQGCDRPAAGASHLRNQSKLAGGGIIQFRRIGTSVAHPSSGDQAFSRSQQNSDVAYPPLAHFTRQLKLARSRIVELSRLVEVLIPSHAAGDKNSAVGQQRRRVP